MRHCNSDCERRFDEASKRWAEEKSRLTANPEVVQAAERRLECRVDALEGVLRDWGYAEDEHWWAADQVTQGVEAPGGSRSGNRMGDHASVSGVHHDLEHEDGFSCAGTDVGDIAAVAATVASKAAISECQHHGKSAGDRQPSKGVDRGQSQGAGGKRDKGKVKGKNTSDAAPSKEGEGRIDMQALPATVGLSPTMVQ